MIVVKQYATLNSMSLSIYSFLMANCNVTVIVLLCAVFLHSNKKQNQRTKFQFPLFNGRFQTNSTMNIEFIKQELTFKTARSSGPGGQNVNKVETKVELRFDVAGSRFLSEIEKQMVQENLANRINAEGILLLTNQTSRSQLDNKEAAIADFEKLILQATTPPKKRKKVKPLTADREKRLSTKKRDSEKKSLRSKVSFQKERDLCFFNENADRTIRPASCSLG